MPHSARLSPIMAGPRPAGPRSATPQALRRCVRGRSSLEQCGQGRAGQVGLGDEAAGPAALDEGAEVRAVPARAQHDRRAVAVGGQPGGDLEAVDVGEIDVEQEDVWAQLVGAFDRAQAVRGLSDDVVALDLQQEPGGRPKAGMVIDDEHRGGHGEECAAPATLCGYGYPPEIAALSFRTASPGSSDPKTADPATKTSAPASAQSRMLSAPTPPSTSISAFWPIRARRRRSLSSDCGRNGWPPQPGLTVMQRTSPTSSRTSATASTGVPGLMTTPAPTSRPRIASTA